MVTIHQMLVELKAHVAGQSKELQTFAYITRIENSSNSALISVIIYLLTPYSYGAKNSVTKATFETVNVFRTLVSVDSTFVTYDGCAKKMVTATRWFCRNDNIL